MKFTNAELTARMISDQKNGWPFCPRCGKLLKIDPQIQRAASSKHTILIALMFSRQQITIIHIVEGCKLLKNMSVFFQSKATP